LLHARLELPVGEVRVAVVDSFKLAAVNRNNCWWKFDNWLFLNQLRYREAKLFFGTDALSFQMTTTNLSALQKTRTFTRFSQAAQVVDARVYIGIHYRTSDTTARAQGRLVANWVFYNYFRRVGGPADEDDEEK
jgi:hypothetical protein